MDEMLVRALLAGVGVALATGPLGVFMVWRRMAYFGDTLSHSALLGVTLGVLSGWSVSGAVLLVCLGVALIISWLRTRPNLPTDTALGILSHGSLALGLVTIALAGGVGVDLMGYLFGDVLAAGWEDLAWIYAGAAVVLATVGGIWRPLLNLTVHEELARVDGVAAGWVSTLYMLLVAITVAVAMKLVGALLITAMLVIPAAAARPFAHSPGRMALLATAAGIVSVTLGLAASLWWDTPSGPSIVLAACLLFLAGLPMRGHA